MTKTTLLSTLYQAIRERNTYALKLIIETGADLHDENDKPLSFASENGYYEEVVILLEHGANFRANDNEALQLAIKNNHQRVINILTQYENFYRVCP